MVKLSFQCCKVIFIKSYDAEVSLRVQIGLGYVAKLKESLHRNVNWIFNQNIMESDAFNSIRERSWIQRGREAVKKVIRCVVCRKMKAKSFATHTPQLNAFSNRSSKRKATFLEHVQV